MYTVRWGATDDLATSSLHSSRLSVFLMAAPSVHEYPSTRVHEYTSTRVHEYTSTRVHEYTSTRVHEYTSTRTIKMCRTLAVVALCLLGMLAMSSGMMKAIEPGSSGKIATPPVGPGLPRPPIRWSCGFCNGYWWAPFQAPCYRWIRRWVWYIEAYCCSRGVLFYFPYYPYYPYPHHHSMYLCYNRYYRGGCGGFLGAGSHLQPCQYNGMKMCGPSYRLSGSSCVKVRQVYTS
ncbi:hypothetical protein NP493_239g00011 [Ridgeia piscesae]|uniref:Uncharacterized protein n=1 Tax=Ridgeia piscesae TaxID=27915 RepID=A0AAD9NZL7_RIDPI|nr:hypothetical protein NP493_239g00011 [Ridgeia piscesae]